MPSTVPRRKLGVVINHLHPERRPMFSPVLLSLPPCYRDPDSWWLSW